jgi:hypothetical protein
LVTRRDATLRLSQQTEDSVDRDREQQQRCRLPPQAGRHECHQQGRGGNTCRYPDE